MAILRQLLDQFLTAGRGTGPGPPKQVLSLGAGFDTTWFCLQARWQLLSSMASLSPSDAMIHLKGSQVFAILLHSFRM